MRATHLPRRAVFGLGSNLTDRLAHLQLAIDLILAEPGIAAVGISRVYETAPVGGPEQPDYLNAVLVTDTALEPATLLAVAQRCEQVAGRERSERWGPRTLDVDVLAVGDVVSDDPALLLPHPRAAERAFVLQPWADVDPTFALGGVTVTELLARVDASGVRLVEEHLRGAA